MREVNQAWQVLSSPDQRRRYDASLGNRRSAPASSNAATVPSASVADVAVDDDLVEVGPTGPLGTFLMRHLPWVTAAVLLLGILLISAYSAGGESHRNGVAPAKTVASDLGGCVVVTPGPVTRKVACDTPGALRLVARVEPGEACPSGAEPRRLRSDGRTDCLAPPAARYP